MHMVPNTNYFNSNPQSIISWNIQELFLYTNTVFSYKNTLSLYGAVSEEVVIEMISGLKLRTQSDILLAISGIAGPGGGTKDKPEGLVWISYAFKNNNIKTAKQKYGPIGRKLVREKSSIESLKYLLSLL